MRREVFDWFETEWGALQNHEDRLDRLERALEALASEPGQPHHAATEALKILNQES